VSIFLTVLHVMACVILVVVVLLQHGKGADVGAVFGGGASNTVFGSRGAGNFLTRLTTGAALLFMMSSLSLSYLANTGTTSGLFEEEAPPPGVLTPAPAEDPEDGTTTPGGFEEVAPPAAATSSVQEPAEPAAEAAPAAEPEAEQVPVEAPTAPGGADAPAPGSPAPANP
jgi:preprotein translocase subunit SecG